GGRAGRGGGRPDAGLLSHATRGGVPKWSYRARLEIELGAMSPHVGSNPTPSAIFPRGEVPERPKGHDWKSCTRPKGVSRVQIPPSPPFPVPTSRGGIECDRAWPC